LHETREALGKDWRPKGTTSEGDVQQKWHIERSALSRFSDGWDSYTDPFKAFAALDSFMPGSTRLSPNVHRPTPSNRGKRAKCSRLGHHRTSGKK
jgi:hypothetical protein